MLQPCTRPDSFLLEHSRYKTSDKRQSCAASQTSHKTMPALCRSDLKTLFLVHSRKLSLHQSTATNLLTRCIVTLQVIANFDEFRSGKNGHTCVEPIIHTIPGWAVTATIGVVNFGRIPTRLKQYPIAVKIIIQWCETQFGDLWRWARSGGSVELFLHDRPHLGQSTPAHSHKKVQAKQTLQTCARLR